jgi:hypothetical protein
MEPWMKNQIEEFFDHKWQHDKNLAIMHPDDQDLLEQLPNEIQLQIYRDFLFRSFLKSFKRYFTIENVGAHARAHTHYTWAEKEYSSFMTAIFKALEPVRYHSHEYIHEELADVNEVHFIETGQYCLGYEVNKKVHLKMKFNQKSVFGTFESSYDKRSLFVYKTYTAC